MPVCAARYQAMHPAKMTFQALRIHINREFEELKRGMTSALKCLKPGGKLGIITWKHSECAIVVDYFRHHEVCSFYTTPATHVCDDSTIHLQVSAGPCIPSFFARSLDKTFRFFNGI